MIKISIIIPVYNIEEYIAACLDSAIGQDFDGFEVIVVDDGSTDNSGKICDGYARDNVRIYHKENGGLSDARNFGLSKARGKYILFVDGDDTITHNACSELYSDAEKNGADTVIGTASLARASAAAARYERIARENFSLHTPYTGKEYLTGCLKGGALRVEVWRTLYRRDFLTENNLLFKKGIMHEDEEFTPRALLAAKSVVLTDLAFYRYNNDRVNSIINSTAKKRKKGNRFGINLPRTFGNIQIGQAAKTAPSA